MAVTTYPAANFQDNLTLNMPGGTGLGNSVWTLNQSTSGLPQGVTFRFLVYTSIATIATTREICEGIVTGANTVSVTARNAEGDTPAIDHPTGSIFAVVNTAGMENAQNAAIADLYIQGKTATVTAGEAYAATTPATLDGVSQTWSLPTLLYESGGQWFKIPSAGVVGSGIRIAMAYNASSGAGATVQIYVPGGLVPITGGTPITSDLGRNLSNSSVAGACELNTRPAYYDIIGSIVNTNYMYFHGPFFNNKTWHQITVPVVSGGAFSAGDVILSSAVTGKWVQASNSFSASSQADILIAAQAATGADQVVQAYLPGSMVPKTVSNGVPYYLGSAGAISTTLNGSLRVNLGIGYDNTLHFNPVILSRDTTFQEKVTAGENWVAGDILYQRSSDGQWLRANSSAAESGICEKPGIAVATHTGGAGSAQLIYVSGATIRGVFTISTYTRLYPSATPGAYTVSAPPSYDTFYRAVAYASEANVVRVEAQQMEFVPTGVQEKGFCGVGLFSGGASSGYSCVNYKKVMSNTPSSITFTATVSSNVATGPTVVDITRFGFSFSFSVSAYPSRWFGTYQTVGN